MENERIIRIWLGDAHESPGQVTHALTLGHHLRISAVHIARFCGANTPPVADDLAAICGAVVYADRKSSRHRSNGWGRTFELEIPLVEFGAFTAGAVQADLEDLLYFLTGDMWQFAFRRRTRKPEFQQPLPLRDGYVAAMSFSEGLDSFAGYQLLIDKHGADQILKVTTSKRTPVRTTGATPLVVPFETADKKKEASYRSRVFPYFVFAALGASAGGCNRVVIPENGQGSLGPALTPFRDEWPFRSCHPAFVSRLARWVSNLLQRTIAFEQPYVHLTKGRVLAELAQRNLAAGWEATRSCSADARQGYGAAGCGFCGGCVLRRVALKRAGLVSEKDRYAFADWGGRRAQIKTKAGVRAFRPVEREVGSYAIRSMAEFARLEDSAEGVERIAIEARGINADGADHWVRTIQSLRHDHASEWQSVIEDMAPDAWFRRVAENAA